MGGLIKILKDGRIAVFGRVTDRCGNPISEAIIVLEGKKRTKYKGKRIVCGIAKTDQNGEYVFFIEDKTLNYSVNVFEDRYHTVEDVVRFIRG